MKKTEITVLIISMIAIVLNFLLVPGGSVLTIVSLSFLATIYFYFSFALFNNIRFRNVFKKESYKNISSQKMIGSIGAGVALSLTAIGVLFKLLSWPGASVNLMAGLLGLMIVATIATIKFSNNKSNYYLPIFKRITLFGVLGFVLPLTPRSTFIDLKYRNHMDYADALKNSIADPTNKELHKILDEERTKMEQSE
jgi:hypothetical protein